MPDDSRVRRAEGEEKPVGVVREREGGERGRRRDAGVPQASAPRPRLGRGRAQAAREAQRRDARHGDVVAVPQVAGKGQVGRVPLDGDGKKPQVEQDRHRREPPRDPRVLAAQVRHHAPDGDDHAENAVQGRAVDPRGSGGRDVRRDLRRRRRREREDQQGVRARRARAGGGQAALSPSREYGQNRTVGHARHLPHLEGTRLAASQARTTGANSSSGMRTEMDTRSSRMGLPGHTPGRTQRVLRLRGSRESHRGPNPLRWSPRQKTVDAERRRERERQWTKRS